jgi:hypothetical protein
VQALKGMLHDIPDAGFQPVSAEASFAKPFRERALAILNGYFHTTAQRRKERQQKGILLKPSI